MCCFPVEGSWLDTSSCQRPSAPCQLLPTPGGAAAPALKWSQRGAAAKGVCTNLLGRGGILAGQASAGERVWGRGRHSSAGGSEQNHARGGAQRGLEWRRSTWQGPS